MAMFLFYNLKKVRKGLKDNDDFENILALRYEDHFCTKTEKEKF